MVTSEDLSRIQKETQAIRLAHQRGEISDKERMKRFDELRNPKGFFVKLFERLIK